MRFFDTSEGPGNGAKLAGLAGADAHCQEAGCGCWSGQPHLAYLSTSDAGEKPAANARDRIGDGPRYNAKGVKIADNVANLHSDNNNLKPDP